MSDGGGLARVLRHADGAAGLALLALAALAALAAPLIAVGLIPLALLWAWVSLDLGRRNERLVDAKAAAPSAGSGGSPPV